MEERLHKDFTMTYDVDTERHLDSYNEIRTCVQPYEYTRSHTPQACRLAPYSDEPYEGFEVVQVDEYVLQEDLHIHTTNMFHNMGMVKHGCDC